MHHCNHGGGDDDDGDVEDGGDNDGGDDDPPPPPPPPSWGLVDLPPGARPHHLDWYFSEWVIITNMPAGVTREDFTINWFFNEQDVGNLLPYPTEKNQYSSDLNLDPMTYTIKVEVELDGVMKFKQKSAALYDDDVLTMTSGTLSWEDEDKDPQVEKIYLCEKKGTDKAVIDVGITWKNDQVILEDCKDIFLWRIVDDNGVEVTDWTETSGDIVNSDIQLPQSKWNPADRLTANRIFSLQSGADLWEEAEDDYEDTLFDDREKERSIEFTVIGLNKLTCTDGSSATNKKEDADSETSATETLYLVQDANKQATMKVDLTWLPADVLRSEIGTKLRWKLEKKAGGDAATGWGAHYTGDFSEEELSLTWTASGTSPEREYVFKAGGDADGDGELDIGEVTREINVTVVKVELKVTHPDSVGPTGSAAKYSNSPATGSADNLFSTWISENFRVKCNIEPVQLGLLLPDDFIIWTVPGKTIPANTTEATLSWQSEGMKLITINFPELSLVKKVHVDIPDVGGLSQTGAAAAISALVGIIPASTVAAYGIEARAYAQLEYPVVGPERDAVRHSYWNALSVSDLFVTRAQTLLITTGHEFDNRAEGEQAFNSSMDLHSNYIGAYCNHTSALGGPEKGAILADIALAYSAGDFWIWAGGAGESSSEGILVKSDGSKIYYD